MRLIGVVLLIFFTTTAAHAQSIAVPEDGGDGDVTTVGVGGGGAPAAQKKETCVPTPYKQCPRVCDVLLFDGIGGGSGGACTVQTNLCTPLPGSPRACDAASMGQAQAAINAGERVTLNQYGSESTRENATVFSTPVLSSEMSTVMSSFLEEGESFMSGPPMTQTQINDALSDYLAENDNFMSSPPSPPPPMSFSSWRDVMPPIGELSNITPQESFSSWPRTIMLPGDAPLGGSGLTGPTSFSGDLSGYAGGSFRWESAPPMVSPFTPDAGPFDFNASDAFVPNVDFMPSLDRIASGAILTSPFSWYSSPGVESGASMWSPYNPFEQYSPDARQEWWVPGPGFEYQPPPFTDIPKTPGPLPTAPQSSQGSGDFWNDTWDTVSSGAASTWDFMRNFNCRVRKGVGQPQPGDSC